MFEYSIYGEANVARYRECVALLKRSLAVVSEKEIQDVDESLYTILTTENGTVTVKNSEYINAVYVESTFDLSHILKS